MAKIEEIEASPAANEVAKKSIAAEKAKFGFNRPAARTSGAESEEEVDDSEDLDESEEEEKVKEEDDASIEEEETDESDESEEESEDDESEDESDDDDDESSSKKAKIPFKKYNELRKELGKAKSDLKTALENNKNLEAKIPDDLQPRIEALSKEIGVSDPESLKKIINLIKEAVVDKNVKTLEDKISKLEETVQKNKTSSVVDEFPTEWKSFEEKSFNKEFPNATTEQKKAARELMMRLAKSPKTGGKVYEHPDTKQKVLDPYPLSYIYFQHKDEFAGLVTGKKVRKLEDSRGGRITTSREEENNDDLHVPKNASAETIRAKDKKYRQLEAGASDRFSSSGGSI